MAAKQEEQAPEWAKSLIEVHNKLLERIEKLENGNSQQQQQQQQQKKDIDRILQNIL